MKLRALTAPLLGLALALAAPAVAAAAEGGMDSGALAALRALAENPAAPQPAALAEVSFSDATWLLDQLTPGEIRRLGASLDKGRLTLPSGVAGAIEARTLKIQGPGDQGGR